MLVWYLALASIFPMAGCARTASPRPAQRRRRPLMMQSRTAADEWEASSKQGILESAADKESPREGPHPLRTADWKLEASQITTTGSVVGKYMCTLILTTQYMRTPHVLYSKVTQHLQTQTHRPHGCVSMLAVRCMIWLICENTFCMPTQAGVSLG